MTSEDESNVQHAERQETLVFHDGMKGLIEEILSPSCQRKCKVPDTDPPTDISLSDKGRDTSSIFFQRSLLVVHDVKP